MSSQIFLHSVCFHAQKRIEYHLYFFCFHRWYHVYKIITAIHEILARMCTMCIIHHILSRFQRLTIWDTDLWRWWQAQRSPLIHMIGKLMNWGFIWPPLRQSCNPYSPYRCHDAVIKQRHFPRYWPFVWRIHRSPVNFPHKGQWRGALMFSLIFAWTNGWVNNRDPDLRRYCAHCDAIVMCHAAFNSWSKMSSYFSSIFKTEELFILTSQ